MELLEMLFRKVILYCLLLFLASSRFSWVLGKAYKIVFNRVYLASKSNRI